jgi:hypothetical protein
MPDSWDMIAAKIKTINWRLLSILLMLLWAVAAVPGSATQRPETSHLVFVKEYIRELAALENVRSSAQESMAGAQGSERFSEAIHASTLIQLELRSQISVLERMHLNPPFDELIPDIIAFDKHKILLQQRLIEISSAFLAGPKPGVDYGKLATEPPKIRAELDYIDRALLDVSPMAFATLIDTKPDSKNHASHLIITETQRADLLKTIADDFGTKLDEKNQNYTVGAASVLRDYLLKDYKCSDDPWD